MSQYGARFACFHPVLSLRSGVCIRGLGCVCCVKGGQVRVFRVLWAEKRGLTP